MFNRLAEEDGGWERLQLLENQRSAFKMQVELGWEPCLGSGTGLIAVTAVESVQHPVLYGQMLFPAWAGLVTSGGVLAYLGSLVLLMVSPGLAAGPGPAAIVSSLAWNASGEDPSPALSQRFLHLTVGVLLWWAP